MCENRHIHVGSYDPMEFDSLTHLYINSKREGYYVCTHGSRGAIGWYAIAYGQLQVLLRVLYQQRHLSPSPQVQFEVRTEQGVRSLAMIPTFPAKWVWQVQVPL